MASKKIQGKYFIYGKVPNSSYTLTGADRQASFSVTGDEEEMITHATTAPNGNSAVVYNVENTLEIVRARILANGGPGLQTGVNHIAAKIKIDMGSEIDGAWVKYTSFHLHLYNWGEWAELNLKVNPFERIDGDSSKDFVAMAVDPNETIFYLDDYNIQEDYVGQGITPIIQMEVKTAGLCVRSNGVIF